MALRTFGTNATNTLTGFIVGLNDQAPPDLGQLMTQLRGDPPGWSFNTQGNANNTGLANQGTNRPRVVAYAKQGLLTIPNRGQLVCRNGDWICWDVTTGWPILISGDAAANGPYTHS